MEMPMNILIIAIIGLVVLFIIVLFAFGLGGDTTNAIQSFFDYIRNLIPSAEIKP